MRFTPFAIALFAPAILAAPAEIKREPAAQGYGAYGDYGE
jgi:hypothetical protein